MNRDLLFWSLALFFGASIAFQAIQRWTESEAIWVTLGLEAIVLAILIAAIVVVVRRKGSG